MIIRPVRDCMCVFRRYRSLLTVAGTSSRLLISIARPSAPPPHTFRERLYALLHIFVAATSALVFDLYPLTAIGHFGSQTSCFRFDLSMCVCPCAEPHSRFSRLRRVHARLATSSRPQRTRVIAPPSISRHVPALSTALAVVGQQVSVPFASAPSCIVVCADSCVHVR
jgi:hypothetical protein